MFHNFIDQHDIFDVPQGFLKNTYETLIDKSLNWYDIFVENRYIFMIPT